MADGVISKSEAEFLVDLRRSAPKAVAKFHQFVFEVVKKAILADGDISPQETAWLEKFILADGKVDDLEKAFLLDLKICFLTLWRVVRREGIAQPGQATMEPFRGNIP